MLFVTFFINAILSHWRKMFISFFKKYFTISNQCDKEQNLHFREGKFRIIINKSN